jgi:alkylation response protein AidB-like acyl-CoA dehydrogenase
MGPIFLLGNEQQKTRYLVPAVRGELLCCFALTEPSGGSDAAAVRTTARRDGEHYVLNGSKTFITNGSFSDVVCVAARTREAAGSKGISLFLVDRNTPGFSVGRKIRKIGWHTSDTVELFFDDCRVPAGSLLGEENRGFATLMRTLEAGRIVFAAYCVGIAGGALEDALAYARQRQAFGHAIGSYQAIKFMLADMQTDLTVARSFVYRVAELADRRAGTREQAAIAKLFASEMADRVTHKAVQIHGGYGFCREFKVARAFCDARIGQIGEGTSEMQRMIISRGLGL